MFNWKRKEFRVWTKPSSEFETLRKELQDLKRDFRASQTDYYFLQSDIGRLLIENKQIMKIVDELKRKVEKYESERI